MATNTKFVQMRNPKLKIAITGADTEAIFTEFVDLNGNPVVQTDFGTVGYGTLAPNTVNEEAVSFVITANPAGEATLTLTRGLLGKHPYGTGGPTYTHQAQTELVISNNPDLLNKLTAKDNDEIVTGSWQFPNPVHNNNPVNKTTFDAQAVKLTTDQTVAGVKTFSSAPKVPDATAADEALTKGQYDTTAVKLTTDQTVAGVKTFSSSPIVPTATTATQAINKSQMESYVAPLSGDLKATPSVFGTVKLDTAADDIAEPKALTATEDRVDALTGGGAFGTPSDTNKFITQEFLSQNTQVIFNTSGTWTKDSGLIRVRAQLWAGGGAGASLSSGGNSGGGGGCGYTEAWFEASQLGATETVTIGSGGASVSSGNGNNGGNTTFGTLLTAYGGKGGTNLVGGNGGEAQLGDTVLRGAGGVGLPGGPGLIYGGGGGGDGGGGGSVGGSAFYGGAGGGGNDGASGYGGGVSVFGGNGGAGNATGAATAGSVPGGGGGASDNGAASGAGAAGRVIITEFYT